MSDDLCPCEFCTIKRAPTKEEIEVALSTINDIATFVAMRGLWMTPVPELVKVTEWLRNLTKDSV